jgi:HNH endonuclease
MSFPADVKEKALVACARRCCLCRNFVGLKIELHHIVQEAEDGEGTFDNCIPLCFDCHGDMRSYDHRHPKGTKYTPAELTRHRNNWYTLVASGIAGQAEAKLYQERTSKAFPDIRLIDVVKRIVGSNDLFVGENCSKCGSALLAIREDAHLGKIAVWGRKNISSNDLALYPLTSIPAEYWDEFGIDYMHFTDDQNGKSYRVRGTIKREIVASTVMTTHHVVEIPDTICSDLWFCQHEVETRWPPAQ